jgi:SAM-dependent methyltransferase
MTTHSEGNAPHEIVWTRDRAQRFWDFQGADRRRWSNYFSWQVGDGLLDFVSSRVDLRGEILDYGCGPGFLVERMLADGLSVTALDFSADSLEALRERVGGSPGLREVVHATGLPLPLSDARFDVVFLVETVEHLMPEDLAATLLETHRVLKPGGLLVATTPNDEVLDAHKVACPECGAVFHQRQHLSSWTTSSLGEAIQGGGLQVIVADAVFLRRRSFLNPIRDLAIGLRGRKPPHIVAVGRKSSERP